MSDTSTEAPLLEPASATSAQDVGRRVALAVSSSLAANVALFVAKGVAFVASGSMAVLASLLDSLIDLASQGIIAAAEREMERDDPRYPAGKSRLETMSVLGCAFLMVMGAVLVIQESGDQLYNGIAKGEIPKLDMTPALYGILAAATAVKAVLYVYCSSLSEHSGAALALAEDHLNDVVSNLGAILTVLVAARRSSLWWVDPAGGILISVVIISRWVVITRRQVHKIVGIEAPKEFVDLVRELAEEHHCVCTAGYVRAYHAGQRLAVDVELEAPPRLPLDQAAQIAGDLKKKLELLPEVEAAAVFTVPRAEVPTHRDQPSLLHTSACKPLVADWEGAAEWEAAAYAAAMEAGSAAAATLPSPPSALPGPPTTAKSAPPALFSTIPAMAAAPPSATAAAPPLVALAPAGPPPAGPRLLQRLSLVRVPEGAASEQASGLHAASLPIETMASRMAWQRSLKDAPGRVLRSASLRAPDSLTMHTAHASPSHVG